MAVKISPAGASSPPRVAANRRNLLKNSDLIVQAGEIRWVPLNKTNPNDPIGVKITPINEIGHD